MFKRSLTNISDLTSAEFRAFLKSFNTVMTDCDGVLWINSVRIDGTDTVLEEFRQMNKKVLYVTNNTTTTRKKLIEKLNRLNFPASEKDVLSTTHNCAQYLKSKNFTKKAFIIGSPAIAEELDLVGIRHIGTGADYIVHTYKEFLDTFEKDKEVGAVIVGFDPYFSFPKMVRALTYLLDPDCLFVGLNKDLRTILTKNVCTPCTGTLLRAIEIGSGRNATCVGKPDQMLAEILANDFGVVPETTLMIGDTCHTDILFGNRHGYHTLLTLSGETTLAAVQKWKNSQLANDIDLVPDFYIATLSDLLKLMCGNRQK